MKSFFAAVVLSVYASSVGFAADKGPAETKIVKNLLSSDIIKADVYDAAEKKLGQIENLLLSRDGTPSLIILGVGGLLGLDAKNVAIPFTQMLIKTRNGKTWFELDLTKDQLKAAPAFDERLYKF